MAKVRLFAKLVMSIATLSFSCKTWMEKSRAWSVSGKEVLRVFSRHSENFKVLI